MKLLNKYTVGAGLALMPTLAFAACGGHEQREASSCMDGYVWDSGAQACVEKTTS